MAVTKEQAIDQIKKTKGLVSYAARRLGISRNQFYKIMEKWPEVKEARDEAREELKDFTELKLYQLIQAMNPWAIGFMLRTQAKDRGYIERSEIVTPEGPLAIIFEKVDKAKETGKD